MADTPTPPLDELHQSQVEYIRWLELRCELLQREVERLRQQVVYHVSTQYTLVPDVVRLLSLPLAELTEHARRLVREWTSATDVYLLRLFPDGSSEVFPERFSAHAQALIEEGVLEWLRHHNGPALLPDLFGAEPGGSLVLLPLGHAGEQLGALVGLGIASTGEWEHLRGQLHALGLVLGIALDNAASVRTAEQLRAQLQQLQHELYQQESLATLGRLTGIVIHELGNPLQALLSHAELIQAGRGNAAEHAEHIRREVLRLQELVSELRQLLHRTGSAPQVTPVDFAAVLRRTLQLLQPQLQRDRIRVQCQITASSTVVLGNAAQLEQLLLNLLLNARDAMPDGGLIRICVETEGTELVVRCSDTGHGIPKELAERVFEPFFTTKPHGSGLGLSVARQIVQHHGGSITLSSEPGMGTTVILRFPLQQVEQSVSPPSCASLLSSSATPSPSGQQA
jgi:signal transduction histidine kinase